MKDRREFLKSAATGAAILGSSAATSKLGFAAMLSQPAASAKSRVVIATDANLQGTAGSPDEQRVLALLDKAMAAYTGREKPVEAWKHAIPANILAGGVIGLKVNGLGGRGISTHAELVHAICERLQQAGVAAGNIVVWDRTARDLQACGLTVNTDKSHGVRVYGNDVAGYEEQPESFGVARISLSKILTRECAMVINLPILKDHEIAGVTLAMKNMYGVVDKPFTLHAGNCNPGVADLNCIPAIRQKVTLTIGDAMKSVYDGGPSFHPERVWYPNAIIVGEDKVALDHTALQMIEKKRAEAGLPTVDAAGRPAKYIATAADDTHRLGTNDPERIHLQLV